MILILLNATFSSFHELRDLSCSASGLLDLLWLRNGKALFDLQSPCQTLSACQIQSLEQGMASVTKDVSPLQGFQRLDECLNPHLSCSCTRHHGY